VDICTVCGVELILFQLVLVFTYYHSLPEIAGFIAFAGARIAYNSRLALGYLAVEPISKYSILI
jgi:hypothetical protein